MTAWNEDRIGGEREQDMRYRVVLLAALFVLLGAWAGLAVGPFSGSWEVEIGLSPQQTQVFSAFSSTLDVRFSVAFLTLSATSDFIESGWIWQELGLKVDPGIVSFEGVVLFEPQSGSFVYAQSILAFDFCPVTLRFYGAMVGAPDPADLQYGGVLDVYVDLGGGMVTLESATLFGADLSGIIFTQTSSDGWSPLLTKTYLADPAIGGDPCCFSGEVVTFTAELFNCVTLESTTTLTLAGFDSQEFEVSFLHILGGPVNVTLDYVFSLQSASHTFTPSLESDFGCVKVYTDLLGTGATITGITITGLAVEVTLAGTTFRSISNLDPTVHVITTPEYGSLVELESEAIESGHLYYPAEYWEVVSLLSETPVGGTTFCFSADTFFGTTTGLLFDWAMSEMGVGITIAGFFTVRTGIVVDTTGFVEWSIALAIDW
jgi:hypothetical protein